MAKFGLTTGHIEKHFTGSETVRDIVIGMSDGLTVPFALAAGLSGIQNKHNSTGRICRDCCRFNSNGTWRLSCSEKRY